MAVSTKHNYFLYNFFKLYTLLKIKLNFSKVVISGTFNDKNLPVILISNHISWWDGFWAMYLNMKIFHRLFFFMMLEEQLDKNSFFKLTGGYPVRKGTKNIIDSLNYTRELLSVKGNLVMIFPQGELSSMYREKFVFERGIERILAGITDEIHIVFMAALPDYFSKARPSLYLYYKEYAGIGVSAEVLEEAYNAFYLECRNTNINRKEG
jgi:1-acyl-sn-glycerol-3-phosphate acyltransferase